MNVLNKSITSKYYTPEIEEFHVGFECEYKSTINNNTYWTSLKLEKEHFSDDHYYNPFRLFLRVKYLDKEDIESLGFNFYKN